MAGGIVQWGFKRTSTLGRQRPVVVILAQRPLPGVFRPFNSRFLFCESECLLFSTAAVQIVGNSVKLGSANGQNRSFHNPNSVQQCNRRWLETQFCNCDTALTSDGVQQKDVVTFFVNRRVTHLVGTHIDITSPRWCDF